MSGKFADYSFLIPAAGQGTRLGLGPKALLALNGQSLLQWLSQKALRWTDDVLVAAPPGRVEEFAAHCPGCTCIAGGSTRQESIALLARASTRPWLLLQDLARPFASLDLISRVATQTRKTGCAGAFLDPEVPVAVIEEGFVRRAYLRQEVGVFQAPQGFSREVLLKISALAEESGWHEQSTVQLALRAGIPVASVTGEKLNIKLTTEDDWEMAKHLLSKLR